MSENEIQTMLHKLFDDGWYDAFATEERVQPQIHQANRDLRVSLLMAEFRRLNVEIERLKLKGGN